MTITMATIVVTLALSYMYCGVLGTYTSGQAQMQTSTSEQYCSFFANRAPAKQPTLKNCTWYNENSCCLQREIDATFNKVKPLQGASRECQRYMNFLMCYICAPNQNLFYSGGELTVCNDFCDKFYEACSSAILKGYVISELYASGYDFCQSRQYRVGAYTDIRCFRYSTLAVQGGTTTVGATSTSVVVALLSSYLLTYNHVTSWRQFNWLNVIAVLSLVGAAFAEMNVEHIAKSIAEDLTSVAARGLEFERIQTLYDNARYKRVSVNGTERVAAIRHKLESFFAEKTSLASDLSRAISEAYDSYHRTYALKHVRSLAELGPDVFMDSDFMLETNANLTRNSHFPRMKIHERQSSVKITDQVDRDDVTVATTVQWTHSVEALMRRNFEQYRSIRWQYFGSSVGVYRQFPGSASPVNFVGFPIDYDARVRPWYLSATSGAKDVVVILDASFTMGLNSGLDIMKTTASTLVGTFSMKDSIAVLVSRSLYWTPAGKEKSYSVTSLGCHAKRLVPMTSHLKGQLERQIEELKAEGGADHRPAFTEAIKLLRSSEAKSCHKLIIFITNGVETHFSLRCDRGKWKYDTGSQLRHKPGVICLNSASRLVRHVREEMGAYKIKSFTLLTAADYWRNDKLGAGLACLPATTVLKIQPYRDVHQQLSPYFTYLHGLTSSSRDVMWTSPYVSSDGLGLMLTAAKSVYSNATGQHLGVVGVDVSLSSADTLLEREQWNTAYGFLIDGRATAVIHPFVGTHDEDVHHTGSLKLGDIVDLETHGRKPEQFTQIVSSMLSGETGDTLLTKNTYTALTSENNLYWTSTNSTHYYYSPISGTDFYYAFRMNQRDADFQTVLPPRHFVTSYLDELRDYQTLPSLKDHRDQLGIEEKSKQFNGLTVARASSVVHLGPRCFCNTLKAGSESHLGLDFLHGLINTSPRPDQYDDGGECVAATLDQQCLADVQLSSPIDRFWKDRDLDFDVLWTYVGLSSGSLRVYPGVEFDGDYEPVNRVWYTAAAVNRGRITVSSPYLDASGAGKVVTVSKTIHKVKPINCMSEGQGGCRCKRHSECLSHYCYASTCANPIIHGVVAMDLSYTSFYERMMTVSGDNCRSSCTSGHKCNTRCLLIDDLGDIVLDRSFLEIADSEQQLYEKVPLAGQFGKVFQTLLRLGIFKKERRLDYQGTCARSAGIWRPWQSPLQPDNGTRTGPFPAYRSTTKCVVEVIYYTTNWEVAIDIGTITDLLNDDPCSSGVYRFTHINGTNLFLLVVTDYRDSASFFNFNCHIMKNVNRPGRFRVREEVCSQSGQFHDTRDRETCPRTQPIRVGDYTCSGSAPIMWNGLLSLVLIRHFVN